MRLSHKRAQEFIERQIDGPLVPAVQQALRDHLEQCPDCYQYARDAIGIDAELARSLPALWPERRAPAARLASTLARIEEASGERLRPRFPPHALSTAVGALLILLLSSLFLRNFEWNQALEEAAYSDGFVRADEVSEYVSVHFELDGRSLPGEGIDLYYPLCDGVEYYPQAGALAQKLALGEPLPECELRPSRTIRLAPGESHDVLLVYRNPGNVPVTFRFVPTSRTELAAPFASQLCGKRLGEEDSCAEWFAPAWGIWAEFLTFEAPLTAEPGTQVTVTARVERIEEDS